MDLDVYLFTVNWGIVSLCFVLFFLWHFSFPCMFVLCNLVLSLLFSLIVLLLDTWLLSNVCGERKGIEVDTEPEETRGL